MPLPKCVAAFLALFAAFATLPQAIAQAPAPREVRILAASDLQPVMPVLAVAFEHATGIKLNVSFGSSATLATQIQNGAPADLFLAADYTFPESIVAGGLADSTSPIPYARGTLVLYARKDSPLQPLNQNTLIDPRIKTLAIADQFHAPYGRAAVAELTALKLYEQLKPRLVVAENISQTAQFVESGNAQLGLISLTLATSDHLKDLGTYIRVPPLYGKLDQCAVVLKNSPHRADAHAFLDWLRSPTVQANLPKYGLEGYQ